MLCAGEERNRRRLKSNAVPSIRECAHYVEAESAVEAEEPGVEEGRVQFHADTLGPDVGDGVKIIKLDPGEVQTEDDMTIEYHVEGTQVAKVIASISSTKTLSSWDFRLAFTLHRSRRESRERKFRRQNTKS